MEFRVKAQGNQMKSLDFAGNQTKTAPEGLQHSKYVEIPLKMKPEAAQPQNHQKNIFFENIPKIWEICVPSGKTTHLGEPKTLKNASETHRTRFL